MAVFKIVDKDEEGNKIYYNTSENVTQLIDYVCRKSIVVYTHNLLNIGSIGIANQMLYRQNCSGKNLITRALHFIFSFDTKGWEKQVGVDTLELCIYTCLVPLFQNHQCLFGIHNKTSNRHIHIVVNPVEINDNHIFHWSQYEFKEFMRLLAESLYLLFGIALQSVSYIKENGNMAWTDNREDYELYENRSTKDTPLIDEKGKIAKLY